MMKSLIHKTILGLCLGAVVLVVTSTAASAQCQTSYYQPYTSYYQPATSYYQPTTRYYQPATYTTPRPWFNHWYPGKYLTRLHHNLWGAPRAQTVSYAPYASNRYGARSVTYGYQPAVLQPAACNACGITNCGGCNACGVSQASYAALAPCGGCSTGAATTTTFTGGQPTIAPGENVPTERSVQKKRVEPTDATGASFRNQGPKLQLPANDRFTQNQKVRPAIMLTATHVARRARSKMTQPEVSAARRAMLKSLPAGVQNSTGWSN